ncbi:hypothetical protein BAUMH2_03650 [Streptococcus agalactiae]|uniref:hypothetical protein n=1 Tax=Streptococcus agalactiae TaxID=1311 RepID=UPI0021D5F2D3|nr:hypothetical protein [Streptococcus agalactiae]MCU7657268.1 hypothetical protein [Streptococcus agalactiae]MCU7679523.1 hypothetical protein [Streptococcus agalactiae]MCU7682184.1 hypothetical protein [Streptococcus agalactiae]
MEMKNLDNDHLINIGLIHEVLSAGDNILKAQELLSNSVQILVNYASDSTGVMYQEHSLIVETLIKTIGELENIVNNDRTILSESELVLFDN